MALVLLRRVGGVGSRVNVRSLLKATRAAAGARGLDDLSSLSRDLGFALDELLPHQISNLGRLLRRRLEHELGPAAARLEDKLSELGGPVMPIGQIGNEFQRVLANQLGPVASTIINQQISVLQLTDATLDAGYYLKLAGGCREEIDSHLGHPGVRRFDDELLLYCGLDLAASGIGPLRIEGDRLLGIMEEALAQVVGPAASEVLQQAKGQARLVGEDISPDEVIVLSSYCWQLLGELADLHTAVLFADQWKTQTGLEIAPMRSAPAAGPSVPPPQSSAKTATRKVMRLAPVPQMAEEELADEPARQKVKLSIGKIGTRRKKGPTPIRIKGSTTPEAASRQPIPTEELAGDLAPGMIYARTADDFDELPARMGLDSFIIGPNNLDAYREVLARAGGERSGTPLVLTGAAGVGKSHLLVGLARTLASGLEAGTGLLFITMETVSQVELLLSLRESTKFLLIEELHRCPPYMIDALAHLIERSAAQRRGIVMTSRTPPRDLHETLLSALAIGTVAELEAPDERLRAEIVAHLLAEQGFELSDSQLTRLAGRETDIKRLLDMASVLAEETGQVAVDSSAAESPLEGGVEPEPDAPKAAAAPQQPPEEPIPSHLCRFAPEFTFETFVEGSSNRMATHAAQAVAVSPGEQYNPLFIYGDVGTGKTHLLNSIGNLIRSGDPRARVLLVNCRDWVDEFLTYLRKNSLKEFRKVYRSAEILMIDDIQFLKGRDQLQEEFFTLFNLLIERGGQVVLSSDTPFDQLEGIEDRLISRFMMGLPVDISTAEMETREAILANMCDYQGWDVSTEVLTLIASKYVRNIRELKGAITRVVAQAQFSSQSVSPQLAGEVLGLDEGQEEAAPTPYLEETKAESEPEAPEQQEIGDEVQVDIGFAYLFEEEGFDRSDRAFVSLVEGGHPALAISRSSPASLARRLGLEISQFGAVWLTQTTTDESVDPADLEVLSRIIGRFVSANDDSAVVLFQGLEYLVAHNDFAALLKLFHRLVDRMSVNEGTLLVSVSPHALALQDLKSLEREFVVFRR